MDCLTLHKLPWTTIFDIRSYKSTSSYFCYDGSQPLKSVTTNVALKVPCCTKFLVFRDETLGISFYRRSRVVIELISDDVNLVPWKLRDWRN